MNVTDKAAHTWHYELKLTCRRRVAVTIETAITIEPYFTATIETWPAKYERL